MLELKSVKPEPDAVEEREPLFSIEDAEGKKITYDIPAKPSAALLLQYLEVMRSANIGAAQSFLLEEMLGAEGYAALLAHKELEHEQLSELITICTNKMWGRVSEAAGNSNGG